MGCCWAWGCAQQQGAPLALCARPHGRPSFLLVWRRFPLRPERAHTDCRGDSHGAPTPRAHGLGGPRCPLLASAARYARTARRRGRLWHIGVSLRLAFLSAGAQQRKWRLSLSLRGYGGCYPQPCSPRVLVAFATRPHRHFRCFTPALTAYVRFGSPARTAVADGSSLPTTARPSSHGALPAPHDGRWWASLRSLALLHRASPSALKGTGVPMAAEGQIRCSDCSIHPLLIPTASPALQVERNQTKDYDV